MFRTQNNLVVLLILIVKIETNHDENYEPVRLVGRLRFSVY